MPSTLDLILLSPTLVVIYFIGYIVTTDPDGDYELGYMTYVILKLDFNIAFILT